MIKDAEIKAMAKSHMNGSYIGMGNKTQAAVTPQAFPLWDRMPLPPCYSSVNQKFYYTTLLQGFTHQLCALPKHLVFN